jgi:hypothetical protein
VSGHRAITGSHGAPLPPAVYVGNYEYDASERELERTFDKYGPVDRVEYKSGACAASADVRCARCLFHRCRRCRPPSTLPDRGLPGHHPSLYLTLHHQGLITTS